VLIINLIAMYLINLNFMQIIIKKVQLKKA